MAEVELDILTVIGFEDMLLVCDEDVVVIAGQSQSLRFEGTCFQGAGVDDGACFDIFAGRDGVKIVVVIIPVPVAGGRISPCAPISCADDCSIELGCSGWSVGINEEFVSIGECVSTDGTGSGKSVRPGTDADRHSFSCILVGVVGLAARHGCESNCYNEENVTFHKLLV